LYYLLTGKAPLEDEDIGVLLQKVQRGDFPPPRQINRTVPPALEAVCLKAMALRPADRYASPGALADDVEHWLAGEPVSAWREPWSFTARRWLSRHHTFVVAGSAVVLVTLLTLAAATVLLSATKERERQAKEREERNFQLAREAVDRYYTKVSEEVLLNEPGLEPLRKKLLEAAGEFYKKFAEERGNDP